MFLSTFDIFKIGIGPSSSHTMGPMIAAGRFLEALRVAPSGPGRTPARVACSLHGSLAYTGRGHGTDRAVILGLIGEQLFVNQGIEGAPAGLEERLVGLQLIALGAGVDLLEGE